MHPTFRNLVALTLLAAITVVHAVDLNVACVGNSITAGYGLQWHEDYPTKLDSILGDGYAVTNYGVSGKTMVRGSQDAWWNQPQFPAVLAAKPDVVVVELGTNDSKSYIWPTYGKDFKTDYHTMIDTLRSLSSKPNVWITIQPWANNASWGMWDSVIKQQINPRIREVAMEAGANLIDLRSLFSAYSANLYLDDSVHPNAAGAVRMAALIAERLKHDRPVVLASEGALQAHVVVDSWGTRWYRNDTLLVGDSSVVLKSSLPGTYKASVKVYQNSDDWIVSAPFVWAGTTSVRPRIASDLRVRLDASGRLQVRDAAGSIVDGIRLRDVRGLEVSPEHLRPGVYTWSLGAAQSRIAVP